MQMLCESAWEENERAAGSAMKLRATADEAEVAGDGGNRCAEIDAPHSSPTSQIKMSG